MQTPLARMTTARSNLLKDILILNRSHRPTHHLVNVVEKLDAAIRAVSAQANPRTRPRAIGYRSAHGHPSLKRKPMVPLMLKIDEDAMALDEAELRRVRRRVR
jgi:hypothetical protein